VIVTAVVVLRYLARRRAANGGTPTGFWKMMSSRAGAIGIAVLLVVSASAATYTISVAGHQGAKLNWGDEGAGGSVNEIVVIPGVVIPGVAG